jgi:LSU ribosomal protein L13P
MRGPKYPKTPDRLFKRMVRGMLPKEKAMGREALKRLYVYIGTPPSIQTQIR